VSEWTIRYKAHKVKSRVVMDYLKGRVFPNERACKRFLRRHKALIESMPTFIDFLEPIPIQLPTEATT